MSKIKQLFEQEILKKIQASNELDKKLEASRLGFNKGISYLENLCEELQTHIPTLGCQLKINDRSKSSGHFIFDANNCRIPIQLWGEYDEEGRARAGFSYKGQEFTLFYKNVYWRGKEDFEQLLINDIVNKLNLIQIQ
jgi:hypothetical protein